MKSLGVSGSSHFLCWPWKIILNVTVAGKWHCDTNWFKYANENGFKSERMPLAIMFESSADTSHYPQKQTHTQRDRRRCIHDRFAALMASVLMHHSLDWIICIRRFIFYIFIKFRLCIWYGHWIERPPPQLKGITIFGNTNRHTHHYVCVCKVNSLSS